MPFNRTTPNYKYIANFKLLFILVDAIQVSIDKVGMRKVTICLASRCFTLSFFSPGGGFPFPTLVGAGFFFVMKRFAAVGFRLYTGADDSDGAGRLGGLTVDLFASIAA
jgi:hypothetical protein